MTWTLQSPPAADWDNDDPTGAFQGDTFQDDAFDIAPQRFVWMPVFQPGTAWE